MRGAIWLASVASCIFLLAGPGTAHAVGTWQDSYCRDGDEHCQTYVPACMECKNVGRGPECRQVTNGETGQPNCTNIYYGTQSISCSATGAFCSQITVIG